MQAVHPAGKVGGSFSGAGEMLAGTILMGFGVFNVVERIIDHESLVFSMSTKRRRRINGFIGISVF